MKIVLTALRWLVGLLFIFSGLIKANDPLGLSYKMQEFFEAWNLNGLHDYTLMFALGMNLLEVVAGVAVIVGWQMKRVSWLLLVLIVFFTFLTSYVLFSGKIHACGCFGDCVPLTPIQTFTKDVALLLMIVLLLINAHKTKPLFSSKASFYIIAVSFFSIVFLQWHVLKYLPILDCLPYAKGKNIVEGMKLPADAKPDIVAMTFKYKKDGKLLEFVDSVPTNVTEDSTYEYMDRYDKMIQKGTGLPKIVDFSLVTLNGVDTTQAILNQTSKYVMLFVKDFSTIKKWQKDFEKINTEMKEKNITVFLVTADAEKAATMFKDVTILKCDATVIKTAARVNPTYFLMKGADIIDKVSYADYDKLLMQLTSNSKP
ncbi:MAG: DoxX family membrane protein [Chitinophagaceae bacterium]|nr:DoxX family membrane protein [Chitinophagaceae bacterium]